MLKGLLIFILIVFIILKLGKFVFFTTTGKMLRMALGAWLTFVVYHTAGGFLAFIFGLFYFFPAMWLFLAAFIFGYTQTDFDENGKSYFKFLKK